MLRPPGLDHGALGVAQGRPPGFAPERIPNLLDELKTLPDRQPGNIDGWIDHRMESGLDPVGRQLSVRGAQVNEYRQRHCFSRNRSNTSITKHVGTTVHFSLFWTVAASITRNAPQISAIPDGCPADERQGPVEAMPLEKFLRGVVPGEAFP